MEFKYKNKDDDYYSDMKILKKEFKNFKADIEDASINTFDLFRMHINEIYGGLFNRLFEIDNFESYFYN